MLSKPRESHERTCYDVFPERRRPAIRLFDELRDEWQAAVREFNLPDFAAGRARRGTDRSERAA